MFFAKQKINIAIQKTDYAPGDTISGNVALILKKPVKAKKLSISLIGEQVIAQALGVSVTTKRTCVYDFEQQLDSEKEYSPGQEYHFEIRIPADTLSMGPQMPEVEGEPSQEPEVPRAAEAMTGAIQFQQIEWHLLAKLDIPGNPDIKKRVDITVR